MTKLTPAAELDLAIDYFNKIVPKSTAITIRRAEQLDLDDLNETARDDDQSEFILDDTHLAIVVTAFDLSHSYEYPCTIAVASFNTDLDDTPIVFYDSENDSISRFTSIFHLILDFLADINVNLDT